MARKPRTQPSPDAAAAVPAPVSATPDEAAIPARRGRRPKAAALSLASREAANVGSPSPDAAGADAPKAGPAKAPGRRGPKQAASTGTAASVQDEVAGLQGQAPRELQAAANPDLTGDDAPAATAAPQTGTAADSDPVQPDRDPAGLASEAAQSVPEAEASVPAVPAARWDRATDVVEFNWPTIEQVAAQDGPNQGMAKLLVAARVEGASSRWPF